MPSRSRNTISTACLVALLMATPAAWACGEGVYNMGQGLRYRGYLTPRPAAVLIYNDQATIPAETKAVYRGLLQAGHRVEVARTPQELAAALRGERFDVVIAREDQMAGIARQLAPGAATRWLPVVDATGGRDRGQPYLRAGASLGQHLKLIDKLVKDRA